MVTSCLMLASGNYNAHFLRAVLQTVSKSWCSVGYTVGQLHSYLELLFLSNPPFLLVTSISQQCQTQTYLCPSAFLCLLHCQALGFEMTTCAQVSPPSFFPHTGLSLFCVPLALFHFLPPTRLPHARVPSARSSVCPSFPDLRHMQSAPGPHPRPPRHPPPGPPPPPLLPPLPLLSLSPF